MYYSFYTFNLRHPGLEIKVMGYTDQRVSMGWSLLRLSAKTLALLRLSVNFFQLRLTKKVKNQLLLFQKVKY